MTKTGKRFAIAGGTLVVLIVVAAAVVLGQLGRLIERGVEGTGPKLTGTDVDLGGARVSIFSGEGELTGLQIANPEGFETDEAFDLGKVAIAVDTASITGDVVRIKSIVVDGPRLVAEFDANGRNNLKTILNHVRSVAGGGGGGGKKDDGGGAQKRLIIDEFRFQNAEVRAYAPAFNVDKTLKLKAVVLKGLGAKQGGAAAADIANQMLRPIVDEAVRAATDEYVSAQRAKLKEKGEQKLMEKLFK